MKKIIFAIAIFLFFLLLLGDFFITIKNNPQLCEKSSGVTIYSKKNIKIRTFYFKKRYCINYKFKKNNINESILLKKILKVFQSKNKFLNIKNQKYTLAYLIVSTTSIFKNRVNRYFIQRLRDYKNIISLMFYYNKSELLQILFNNINVKRNIYGVEIASKIFFGKSFFLLTKNETGILLDYIFNVKNVRCNLKKEFDLKIANFLRNKSKENFVAENFLQMVVSFYKKRFKSPDGIAKIFTTLNLDKQKFLEKNIEDYLVNFKGQSQEKKQFLKTLPILEGAAVEVDISTGGLQAIVGGVKYNFANQLNRAVFSRRQISSTIKPFLYGLAFEEKKVKPDSDIFDKPIVLKNRDGSPWKPENFYPYYLGKIKVKEGLVLSINTIAVQLIQMVGVNQMANYCKTIFAMPDNNIKSRVPSELSLSLGSLDLTPLELANGYLTIASLGLKRNVFFVKSIESPGGDVLYSYHPPKKEKRIYKRKTMITIRNILEEVVTNGTAAAFRNKNFNFDVCGKTGSSPNDSWFVGFNPDTLILAWAGYDIPIKSEYEKLPEFVVLPFWFNLMYNDNPKKKYSDE